MKRVAFLGCVVVLLALTGLWFILRDPGSNGLEVVDAPVGDTSSPGETEGDGSVDADYVVVGGVKRLASDIQSPDVPTVDVSGEAAFEQDIDYGKTQAVPADANPQVASAVAAIRAKEHVERVSALVLEEPFDAESFAADPQAYLDTVAPGRVFQTAQPGPGVSRSAAVSDYLQQVVQGDSVTLQVQAPAGAPVTFSSFDLGAFENRLTTITVQADEEGLAQAEFIASSGAVADVNILAGSPEASGQAKFVVHVQRPAADAGDR